MINKISKKTLVSFILAYCFAYLLQIFFPIYSQQTTHEGSIEQVNLVVLLIDKKLDENKDIKRMIDRYASEYIQAELPNTKAIVIPLDVKTIKAWDIVKMLENIYFDGSKNKTSELKGVILIGKIPFPVVYDKGYVFPSILPYTDFQEQKYIWDKTSQFFVANKNSKSTPELWHGVIDFDYNVDAYIHFFTKLNYYRQNRGGFVGKNFWYDDFVLLKQTFSPEMLGFYLNGFLFAEDVAYHRFTDLLIGFFGSKYNNTVSNMIGDYVNNLHQTNRNDPTNLNASYNQDGERYKPSAFITFLQSILGQREKTIQEANKLMAEINGEETNTSSSSEQVPTQTPTLFLQKAIEGLIKTYNDVVGVNYIKTMMDNVKATARRSRVDSHVTKMIHQDTLYQASKFTKENPLLLQYNTLLEQALTREIENKKYSMRIPIPTNYQNTKYRTAEAVLGVCPFCYKQKWCEKYEDDKFVNYYFGKEASTIQRAEELSIYRGQFANIFKKAGLDIFDFVLYKQSFISGYNENEIIAKSVGSSYGVNNIQIEANRGYNVLKGKEDSDLYEKEKKQLQTTIECTKYFKLIGFKIFCLEKKGKLEGDDEEDPEDFAQRVWGGASMLAANEQGRLEDQYPEYAQVPLYDIAGAKALPGSWTEGRIGQPWAYSYLARDKYASLIHISDRYGPKFYNKVLVCKKVDGLFNKSDEKIIEYDTIKKNIALYKSTGYTSSKPWILDTIDPCSNEKPIGDNYSFDYLDVYKHPKQNDETKKIIVNGKVVGYWDGAKAGGKCGNVRVWSSTYVYKTIDSTIINTSPTPEQIIGSTDQLFGPYSFGYQYAQGILSGLRQQFSTFEPALKLSEQQALLFEQGYKWLDTARKLIINQIEPTTNTLRLQVKNAVAVFLDIDAFIKKLDQNVVDLETQNVKAKTTIQDITQAYKIATTQTNAIEADIQKTRDILIKFEKQYKAQPNIYEAGVFFIDNESTVRADLTKAQLQTTNLDLVNFTKTISGLQTYRTNLSQIQQTISGLQQKLLAIKPLGDTFTIYRKNSSGLAIQIQHDAIKTNLYLNNLINISGQVVSGYATLANMLANDLSLQSLRGYIDGKIKGSQYEYTGLVFLQSRKSDIVEAITELDVFTTQMQRNITRQQTIYAQFDNLYASILPSLLAIQNSIQEALLLTEKLDISNFGERKITSYKIPVVQDRVQKVLTNIVSLLDVQITQIKTMEKILLENLQRIHEKIIQTATMLPILNNMRSAINYASGCHFSSLRPFCNQITGLYKDIQTKLILIADTFQSEQNRLSTISIPTSSETLLHLIKEDIIRITSVTDMFGEDMQYPKIIKEIADGIKQDVITTKEKLDKLDEVVNLAKKSTDIWQWIHIFDDDTHATTQTTQALYPFLHSNIDSNSDRRESLRYIASYIASISSILDNQVKSTKNGMNITTTDRPIDSFRTITFQGIGGGLVVLPYPNFYEVPVFKKSPNGNILELLDEASIRRNIEIYLRNLVKTYNEKLAQQLTQSKTFYTANKKAFDAIASIDPFATPNRTYTLLPEDFLIKKLIEKDPEALDTIAHILSIQNSMWQKRPYSKIVSKDLSFIQESADINQKIARISYEYLIQNNPAPSLSIPDYQASGYEVAYINSDGNDYIDINNVPAFIEKIKKGQQTFLQNKPSKHFKSSLPTDTQEQSECLVPFDGAYLFILGKKKLGEMNWFEAFDCWLKKELTANFVLTYKHAQGPVIPLFDKDIWNKKWFDEATQQLIFQPLNHYTGTLVRYREDLLVPIYEAMIRMYEERKAKNPNNPVREEKIQRYKAKIAKLKQDTSIQENTVLSGSFLSPDRWQSIVNTTATTIASYIHESDGAKIPQQTPSFLLEYVAKNKQDMYLTITNNAGFTGDMFVFVSSSGTTNILTTSGTKLTSWKYKKTFSFPGKITIPLQPHTFNAGVVTLDVHICNPSEYIHDSELTQADILPYSYRPWEIKNGEKIYYTQCFTKTHTISILPGEASKVDISLPTEIIVDGSSIPVSVKAYDTRGNPISQTRDSFIITVTTGTLGGKSKIEITKFPKILSYKAPILPVETLKKIQATFLLTKQSAFSTEKVDDNKLTYSHTVTIAKPTVQLTKIPGYKTTVTQTGIVAGLGETMEPYQYVDDNGITQFRINNSWPSVIVYLKDEDGKYISAPVQVEKVGSISPCVLKTKMTTSPDQSFTGTYSQTVCTYVSEVVVPITGLRIYLPTFSMQAGESEFGILLSNQQKVTIPITYFPASHRITKISFPTYLTKDKKQLSLAPDTKVSLTLFLTDVRGNTITKPTSLTLASVGNLVFSGGETTKTVVVSGGNVSTTLITKKPGGKAYMIAYNAETGYTFENQQVGIVDFLIQGNSFPKTGLNVMYLNLFGTDWGNLWGYFSDNINKPGNILASSDKLLSITTQLIDPSKLCKFDVIITSQGQVSTLTSLPVNLTLEDDTVRIAFDTQTLVLGKVTDFTLQEMPFIDTMDSFMCLDEDNGNIVESLGTKTLLCGSISEEIQKDPGKTHRLKPGNSFVYIPIPSDSVITSNTVSDGKILINNEEIIDIKRGRMKHFVHIEASEQQRHHYTVWNVYWYDKLVGRLLVYRTDGKIIEYWSQTKNQTTTSYQSSITFTDGSTNGELGIGFYNQDTGENYKKEGISSLEDSKDTSLYVGFRHPFQNITAFAAGQSVGEATRTMMSEFGINFGDPLVRRIDHNDYVANTHMDANPGAPLFALAGEEILKTFIKDMNSDGLQDMVIAYKNGKVRWLKNYGGKDAFTDLHDLLRIAEPIKDIFVGDVDANGYNDFIVLTQTDRIRIYTNTKGIFSVDGYPACLQLPGNISSGSGVSIKNPDPSFVRMAKQIFFEDMDRDGNIDIITNDEDGDIKIHYGGKSALTENENTLGIYLSSFLTGCDAGWIQRQKDDVKIIKSYVVSVNSGQKVVDNSLIRRPGVDAQAEEEEANQFNVNMQDMVGEDVEEKQDPPATLDIRPEYNSLPKKKREKVDKKMVKNLPGVSLSAFPRDKAKKLPQPLKRLVSKKLRNQQNTPTKPPLPDISQFPLDSFIKQGTINVLRWVVDPQTEIMPTYEKNLTIEDIRYHPLSKLIPTKDWFKVYKTYEDINGGKLRRGDWVRVTITVEGKANIPFTYINEVSGPWNPNLLFATNGKPRGFFTKNINSGAVYHRLTEAENYTFMLDNLLITNEPLQFGYLLQYQGGSMVNITIDDVNKDTYPDIKVYPKDGCPGIYYTLINAGTEELSPSVGKKFRTYVDMVVDTNPAFTQLTTTTEATLKEYFKEITKGINEVISSQDINALPGGSDILETFGLDSFFDDQMEYSQTVDSTSIIDAGIQALTKGKLSAEKVNQALDTALQGLCEGFKIGKGGTCKGPPIPFNMAFLAPGNFQIFGCKIPPLIPTLIGNDSGLPLLAFPATLYAITPIPVPSILGIPPILKMPGIDTYGYFNALPAPGGVYPSLIRIYLAPTLTLGLGFAFCFGPQVFMNQIPSPLRDIAGNCIVFAISKGGKCKDDQKNTTGTIVTDVVNNDIHDRSNLKCSNPPILPGPNNGTYTDVSSSAFSLLAENPVYTFKKDYLGGFIQSGDQITLGAGQNPDVKNSDMKPPLQEGQYGPWGIGIIQFDVDPLPPEKIITDKQDNFEDIENIEDTQTVDKVSLVPAKKIDLKIKGGMEKAKGLIKCIVNDRVERQVKYIINNLTNMTIGLYLPDLSTLFVGFDKISIEKMQELMKRNTQAEYVDIKRDHTAERIEGDGTTLGNLNVGVKNVANKVQTRAKNNMLQQAQLQNFSQTVSNPFDAIATMFDNVPLINFSPQEVNIQVPLLYSEDIVRYSAHLQTWLSTSIHTMIDWKKLIDGLLGFCNQSYDVFDAETAMRKIASSSNLDPFETESVKQKYKELQTKAIDSLTLKKKTVTLSLYGQELTTLLKKKTYETLSPQDKQEIKNIISSMHDEFAQIKTLIQKDKDLANSMEPHLTNITRILTDLTRHVNTYIATEAENKQKRLEYHQAILALERQKGLKQTQLQTLQAIPSPTEEQKKQIKQLQQDIKELDRTSKRYEENIEVLKQKISENDIYTDIAKLNQALQTTKQKGTIHNACLDLVFGRGFGDQIDVSFMQALKAGIKAKVLQDLEIAGLLPNTIISPLQWFEKFLRVQENMALAVQNVRANLKTLDQYRQFPLQLYERIHVIDRYMTEISFVVENFMGRLIQWLQVNARRFEQYVDAIITLIGVIKTRQAIIDLSVNRQKKCSTCTNDNYTFYGCGFGFICKFINIPILPIPPFRIPSIFLDFSHISANINIKLPEFHFVPTAVPLPQLPDLPGVPPMLANFDINNQKDVIVTFLKKFTETLGYKIGFELAKKLEGILSGSLNINIKEKIPGIRNDIYKALQAGKFGEAVDFFAALDLVNIPTLPAPPTLPPLPSFIPSVEVNLPTLPPAPKIPNLIPKIEGILDVADLVGKIYCIIKGGIGLVGEKGVKSKIEQLTQRTRNVPWFDDMDLTLSSFFKKDRLQGFDRKIDAYVTFKYNFGMIYDIIQAMAEMVNQTTSKVVIEPTITSFDKANQRMNEKIQEPLNEIENTNIRLDAMNWKNKEKFSKEESTNKGLRRFVDSRSSLFAYVSSPAFKSKTFADIVPIRTGGIQQPSLVHLLNNLRFGLETPYSGSIEVSEAKKILRKGLHALIEKDTHYPRKEKVKNTLRMIETEHKVDPNISSITAVHKEAQHIINAKRSQINEITHRLSGSYDKFLSDLLRTSKKANVVKFSSDILQNQKTKTLYTLSSSLFVTDQETKELLKNQEHPMLSYTNIQQQLVSGFAETLRTSTPARLGMDDITYVKLGREIAYVQSGILLLKNILNDKADYHALEKLLSTKKNMSILPPEKQHVKQREAKPRTCTQSNNELLSGSSSYKQSQQTKKSTTPPNDTLSGTLNSFYGKKRYASLSTPSQTQQQPQQSSSFLSSLDIGEYIQGVYIKGITGEEMIQVVASETHNKNIGKNYSFVRGLNDKIDDIVLRDTTTVYLKRGKQNTIIPHHNFGYTKEVYRLEPWIHPKQFLEKTIKTDGYIRVLDIDLKVASFHTEVKNFKAIGQSYEAITLSWQNSKFQNTIEEDYDSNDKREKNAQKRKKEEQGVAGYILKLTKRADMFDTKGEIKRKNYVSEFDSPVRYILLLPQNTTTGGVIFVPGELHAKKIEKYLPPKQPLKPDEVYDLTDTSTKILTISSYDPTSDTISFALTKMPRAWYYLQIATLVNKGTQENPIYVPGSPWSNQVLAGQQLIADDKPPLAHVELYRRTTKEIVGEGTNLEGYINTHYDIRIKWNDNVEVAKNRVNVSNIENYETLKFGKYLSGEYGWIDAQQATSGVFVMEGDMMLLSDIFLSTKGRLEFTIGAVDVEGNQAQEKINVVFTVPSIDIVNITQVTTGWGTITAQISHDMDEGSVQFQRDRNGIREPLTSKANVKNFQIRTNDTTVTGGLFSMNNDIILYLPDKTPFGTIKSNGKIEIYNQYSGRIHLDVTLTNNIPLINIFDIQTNKNLFSLLIPPKKLVPEGIILHQGNLTQIPLDTKVGPMFSGGTCIAFPQENCSIYISPRGNIYIPPEKTPNIRAFYNFDEQNQTVDYTFTDKENNKIVTVKIVPKPLIKE